MSTSKLSHKSTEDYLYAPYSLSRNGDEVSTTDIAHYLKISAPSVTEMLRILAQKILVKYAPYQGATLTDSGLQIAKKLTRKRRLLERFLHDFLKLEKAKVDQQANELEHVLSDEVAESLCNLLKHPDRCSDHKIIPKCDLPFSSCEECIALHNKGLEEVGKRQQKLVSICHLKAGACNKVSFIRGEHRTLQRLLDMGLTPGTTIKVNRVAPLKGPIEVCVRGSKVALGQDVAANVFVE